MCVNMQVHKCPAATRPIINTCRTMLQPIACYINELRVPIQAACQHVCLSSRAIANAAGHMIVFAEFLLMSVDVCNGCHSIVVNDLQYEFCLIHVMSRSTRAYCSNDDWSDVMASFIIEGMHRMTEHQLLTCLDLPYGLHIGVMTGLNCASTCSNIYLAEFDVHNLKSMAAYASLPTSNNWDRRYIDDDMRIGPTTLSSAKLIEIGCSWHHSINVEASAVHAGKSTFSLTSSSASATRA